MRLKLPEGSMRSPTFHTSQVKVWVGDDGSFPGRGLEEPGLAEWDEEGEEHYTVERFLKRRTRKFRGVERERILVRWAGYGPEEDLWLRKEDLVQDIDPETFTRLYSEME